VSVGCEGVLCVVLHGIACVFAHPTHLGEACVGCRNVVCILVYTIVCVFSHPTHLHTL